MEKAFRKTGIDIIGDAPWGTHLCQFYQTKKDLIDVLVPYFKAGLENNEFCMWITSEPLKVEDAKAVLKKVVKNLDHFIKKGQIEILDYSEWYTKSGKFDANNVLQGWVEKENQALKRGYDGLRLSGNTFWLAKRDWRNFTDYEEEVNNLISKYRMIAICTYSLGKCGASGVIDVVSNHQFALVRREGEWVIIESSDRKRAEKTLQSSEANLRKIIEKNADGIVIVDKDGLVRYVNPAAEALFGCKAEELIGELFGFPLTASEATEIDIIRRDGGGTRVAEMRMVEMEWEEKNAYLASVHDITERKRAEEALRKSEERYRTILETIEEGYFEVDIGGNFTFFNGSLSRLLGYSRDEMMGMNNRQYTDKENAQKLYQAFNRVYRTGEPAKGFDWEIIRKDGTKRNIETSVSLIKNSSGQPIGFRGVVRDITERMRTEEALKESEERYRTAIESSNDGVSITKGDLHLFVNRKYLEIFGYNHLEEIVGKPPSITVHPDEKDRVMEITRKRQAGEDVPSKYEFKGIRKDGDIIYIEVSAAKTIYRGEAVSLAYLRDITERKRAEEEMAAVQEQFRQSQKMEAIGQLAGGIAHDFNNLLTVVKGYSQIASMELKEGDPLKERLELIKRAADRAADLTRQLLAFSRRQILEFKVIDLNTALRNLEKMLRRVIGEDIELVIHLPEDLGGVKTDPGQIEQVIMNLTVNAKDAMPSGGKLTIETANVELDEEYARNHVAVKTGGYVMLAVSDTGMGMTPEVRDRVFEPFFTTKEEGKGTGLGLSTVYGIVKQSG
ncbi:MAG: PAS domain S-box protein, partial [Desulfobacterales bacterium]|nr:PAS domain S-box protein [Desulfobacterales bacterium]